MKEYVIWNFPCQQWWLPGRVGCTSDLSRAGRFTRAVAALLTIDGLTCDDYAVHVERAQRDGPPKYHPYGGTAK